MAIKGVAITVSYWAWDTSANAYKTGDVGNHHMRVTKDGTNTAADNAPAEVDSTNAPGEYKILLSTDEIGGNVATLGGKSDTADIILIFTGNILTEQGIMLKTSTPMTDMASIPGATATIVQALSLIFMFVRNLVIIDTSLKMHKDDGTQIGSGTVTDDGVTFTKNKLS